MEGKTLVLYVTTHGVLPLVKTKDPSRPVPWKPQTFKVPSGMNILRIGAVRPGVCNVASESDSEIFTAALQTTLKNPNINYDDAKTELRRILSTAKGIRLANVQGVQADKSAVGDAQYRGFTQQSYETTVECRGGEVMLDKQFSVGDAEGRGEAYNYKINVINSPGTPDLFQYLTTDTALGVTTRAVESTKAEYGLQLSQIVKSLKASGVTDIIMFDFSCSSFYPGLDERPTRWLRAEIQQQGIGRKTRRRRHKRKTEVRSRRKRAVQWKPSNRSSRNTSK